MKNNWWKIVILVICPNPLFMTHYAVAQQSNSNFEIVEVGRDPKFFKNDLRLEGTTWGIRWEGPREEIVENKILAEFGKRKIHASFVVPHLETATDPCRIPGQPVICIVIHKLTKNPIGFENSYSYLTGSGRGFSNSSYSSTSGNVTSYATTITLELYRNSSTDESPIYLAADGKQFAISNGTSTFMSFGFGGGASSSFTGPGNVRGAAMHYTESSFRDLLSRNAKNWSPEAPSLITKTFRQ